MLIQSDNNIYNSASLSWCGHSGMCVKQRYTYARATEQKNL